MAHAAPMCVGHSPCKPYMHASFIKTRVKFKRTSRLLQLLQQTGAEWPKLWVCGRLPSNFRWSRFLASKGGSWGPGFTSSHVCMCNVRIPLWFFNPLPPNNFLILVPWNLRAVWQDTLADLSEKLKLNKFTYRFEHEVTHFLKIWNDLSRLLLFDFLV